MKKLFFFTAVFVLSLNLMAQGNSKGKGNSKNKDKVYQGNESKAIKHDNNGKLKGSTGNVQKGKSSKNQPKKVQAALIRDYPGARNVVWSKYKGDYTATFYNGGRRSTSLYHANGERRETRTRLTRQQLPGTIWDVIFKRDNVTPTSYMLIERPTIAERIFRVLSGNNTPYYYTENGNKIQYYYY